MVIPYEGDKILTGTSCTSSCRKWIEWITLDHQRILFADTLEA